VVHVGDRFRRFAVRQGIGARDERRAEDDCDYDGHAVTKEPHAALYRAALYGPAESAFGLLVRTARAVSASLYGLRNGRIVAEGPAATLRNDASLNVAYLGE
jgi:hypothetical protein